MREVSAIAQAKDQKSAVSAFREGLAKYEGRIACSKAKMQDIYDGATPSAPYVEYGLADGKEILKSDWVRNEYQAVLSRDMQDILLNLELLKGFDYVPYIGPKGIKNSGYIAKLFGSLFTDHGGSGIVMDRYAIQSAEEVDDLVMPNIKKDPTVQQLCEHVKFLTDALEGAVDLVYPQLQGPATNSFRVIDQEEGLMATLTDPESMRKLGMMVTRTAISVLKELAAAAGSLSLFRPRGRFYQPGNVKGLLVDDWISTMSPQSYYDIYRDSFQMMQEEIGDIFFHTCGPALQAADILVKLPGVRMMECAFLDGQTKCVKDLFRMKQKVGGQMVFCSFGLPCGEIVQDEENLTRDVLIQLSQGGRFAIQAYGSLEYANQLAKKFLA